MKKPSILGIIWRPQVELERIRQQPVIWLPLIILSLVHMVGLLFATRVKSVEWSNQTQQTISYTYMLFDSLLVDLLSFLLTIGVIGILIYFIAKVLRRGVTLFQVFALSIFLQVIPTLGLLIQALVHVLEWKEKYVFYNLAEILHLSTGHLAYAFGYITIFVVWNWIVNVISYRKVIGFSMFVSIIITILMWYLPIFVSSLFIT